MQMARNKYRPLGQTGREELFNRYVGRVFHLPQLKYTDNYGSDSRLFMQMEGIQV